MVLCKVFSIITLSRIFGIFCIREIKGEDMVDDGGREGGVDKNQLVASLEHGSLPCRDMSSHLNNAIRFSKKNFNSTTSVP